MRRQALRRSTRMAGMVRRYHTWPTIQTQCVDAHTYHVLRIYRETFGQPSADVTDVIIYHDSPELWTGDPPFPIKLQYPPLKQALQVPEEDAYEAMGIVVPDVGVDEKRRIKICDLVEMMEFGITEHEMGNSYALPIIADTLRAAMDMATESERRDVGSYVLRTTECLAHSKNSHAIFDIVRGYFKEEEMKHVVPD